MTNRELRQLQANAHREEGTFRSLLPFSGVAVVIGAVLTCIAPWPLSLIALPLFGIGMFGLGKLSESIRLYHRGVK
jgi:hypothetical protein